jgi:hypothetical protein
MSMGDYDRWKLATPWDDYEDPPRCTCDDVGWVPGDNDIFVPCPECRRVVTLDDILDEDDMQREHHGIGP